LTSRTKKILERREGRKKGVFLSFVEKQRSCAERAGLSNKKEESSLPSPQPLEVGEISVVALFAIKKRRTATPSLPRRE